MPQSSAAAASANPDTSSLAQTLLHIAWLSIVLGLTLEFIMLAIVVTINKLPGAESIFADVVQKISWSAIVCTGLAVAKAASSANPAWMGLAGLVSAPTALAIARTLHQSTAQALKAADAGASAAFPFFIAAFKGVEYAALGLLLGWIAKRANSSVLAYGGGGLLIGALFGTTIAATSTPGGFQSVRIIPSLANEVLFPVGCSLAIYAADAIGKQMRGKSQGDEDC